MFRPWRRGGIEKCRHIRSKFFHLALRRGRKIAKVAMARKLAVHLYWMWRQGRDYGQLKKFGSQGRKLSSHAVTKGSIR